MILGIDLGTSNSMAAVYRDGQVEFVKSRTGSIVIPSVVSMDENGVFHTGDVARERLLKHSGNTVDMFKRSMGTKKTFTIGDKEIRAEEISAILLRSIKEDAEAFLGETITDAVISVPAFFKNPQRKAVLRAGELAGFNVRKIINEPTSAAMAYGLNVAEDEEKIIIVLDLGGGTFDISVMEINGNVMEVVAICGDNKLGGGDFTKRMADLFLKNCCIEGELSGEDNARLWKAAEKAKHQITSDGKGEMCCTIAGREYTYSITEEEYAKECKDLLEKIRRLTLQAVHESKYEPSEINEIIMVGGGTRLSIVHKMLEKMAGKELNYKLNPDEAVAAGAAIQGAMLERNEDVRDIVMTDICPHYIGVPIWTMGTYDTKGVFDVIVPKNTTIPAKRTVVHNSSPNGWILEVMQSEDEYGINSQTVGTFSYKTPELGTETVDVHKSIIYDNNGIIYAEVYVPANGMRYGTTITSDDCEMTLEEANKRIEELQCMNLGPREAEGDLLLLAKAENIYMEHSGKEREMIGNRIGVFEDALQHGKITAIRTARKQLTDMINAYEGKEI